SGELEFEEFVELAAKFLIEEDEEALKAELKEAFRIYDKGGNGYITTETLKEILRELDNRLTEEELEGIIEEVDEDGSGTLDFDVRIKGGGVGYSEPLAERSPVIHNLRSSSIRPSPSTHSPATTTTTTTTTVMDLLEEEQITALEKAFNSFDTDAKGYITPETVGVILRMMGVKISEKHLQEVIAETDEDGSGQLEFEEFAELAAKFLIEEDQEALQTELKEAFRIYDREGNGYISVNTLKEILRELDSRLTEDDLDCIIEEIDEDGSGTIDFNEFMKMMNG
ncbi:hypothetical protein Pmani_007774, partial [Petrolisthes manimaculis]